MTATTDQLKAEADPPSRAAHAYAAGAVEYGFRHAWDLIALTDIGPSRWTDALLGETRAHLSGCLNAVELAISLQMGDNWLARTVEALGPNFCRDAVERSPALLSPLLVGHLRQRAAAALVLRTALGMPAVAIQIGPEAAETTDQRLGDALAALRLSLDPWYDPQPVDRPMRADLPAEVFCDLVWTAAALLVDGLAARMGVDSAAAISDIGRAAQAVIARHDEQNGPFARAVYVALILADDAQADRQALQAAFSQDLLLLAAIGARRCRMSIERALALLIDGNHDLRAAFARVLHLSDDAYAALLTGLGIVRDDMPDSALLDLVPNYQRLTPDLAMQALTRWSGPEQLIEKLARMDWSQP